MKDKGTSGGEGAKSISNSSSEVAGRENTASVSSASGGAGSANVAPAITQPKGGGALRGIGEKFSAVPSTGAATLEIPITCPQSRNNSAPSLTLSYSSGAGNGPYGLGWSLSFLSIARKTDKGVPRYDEQYDEFVLSGHEDLVRSVEKDLSYKTTSAAGDIEWKISRYRTRVEGDALRIERWVPNVGSATHWRITNRDNVTTVLGYSESARIADSKNSSHIYLWYAEEVRDDRGNVTLYQYKEDDSAGIVVASLQEHHRYDESTDKLLCAPQKYLKRILYGNRKVPSDYSITKPDIRFLPVESESISTLNFCFHVLFDYGEHGHITRAADGEFNSTVVYDYKNYLTGPTAWLVRTDPFSTCRPGFELRTYRLCQRVLIFHHFKDELGDNPQCVSQQVFIYENRKHLTRLAGFEINGFVQQADGTLRADASQATPPLSISYSDAAPAVEVNIQEELDANLPPAVTGAPNRWLDLDGDGVAGALYVAQRNWFYRKNLGAGVLAEPVQVGDLPSAAFLDSNLVQLMDVDADGRIDLVELAESSPGFHSRIPGDGWSSRQLFQASPRLDRGNRNLRYVDLTGDGLADILITETDALVWLQSLGKDGYTPHRKCFREIDEAKGPIGLFDDGKEQLLLADMNGDGLVDLVRIRNGSVCYWPSYGHGNFGPRVTMVVPGLFDSSDAFDTKRIRLADVDGSGTIDIIYLHADRAKIYANLSGNELASPPIEVAIPKIDNLCQVEVIDILGRGTVCLVWSSNLPASERQALRVFDLMGGVKPHLLTHIENGFGGTTDIHYTTSTLQFLEDRAAGRQWLTSLPFPVQVVSKVEKNDRIAGTTLTTCYAYRHGYFDSYEREFRGFGFVEQTDAELFPAISVAGQSLEHRPPVVTRTWFHTGALLDGERLEKAFANEYFSGDPIAARLPDTQYPAGVPSWELRDIVRGFKGRPLRVEVYACDAESGTALDPRPYSVLEHSYIAKLLQASDENRKAVIRVDVEQTLTFHYERELLDPRVTHDLVLTRDEYGNPLRSASLAYPRRKKNSDNSQKQTLALLTKNWVVNDTQNPQRHRVGVGVAETRSEVIGLGQLEAGKVFDSFSLDRALTFLPELPWGPVIGEISSSPGKRLLGASIHRFWSDDTSAPLAVGQIGVRALAHGRIDLAFDTTSLRDIFQIDDDISAILRHEHVTLGYESLPKIDKKPEYISIPSGADIFWRVQGYTEPDKNHFFIPQCYFDAFGAKTKLIHDSASQILISTVDPLENKTTAEIDYRVLSAKTIVDPNGNVSRFAYEPNGKLSRVALLGKGEGDTLDEPTIEYQYAMRTFSQSSIEPMHVLVWEREQHVNTRVYRSDQRRQRVEYTDGSGREALTMREAEPGPVPVLSESGELRFSANGHTVLTVDALRRWVGSGRTIYDNKGNPIRKFEPFFWPNNSFLKDVELRQWGVSPALHYDPMSRLIRTDNPDGSCACVCFSAWHVERWDEVDTVLAAPVASPAAPEMTWLLRMQQGSDQQKNAARKAVALAGTPQTEHFDALGRVILRSTPELNPVLAAASGKPEPYIYTTRHLIDLAGNELATIDTTGREAARRVFDLLGRPLILRTLESGSRWTLPDAANQAAYTWSDRGLRWRLQYDSLHRPSHRFIRWPTQSDGRDPLRPLRIGSGATQSPTAHRGKEVLAERFYYGEDMPAQEAKDANTLGHLVSHFDDAGHLHLSNYDFKGNVIEQKREVCSNYRIHADWSALDKITDRYKAHVAASRQLEQRQYTVTTLYDARNRVVEQRTPDDRTIRPSYNAAGLLETLDVFEANGKTRRRVIDNIDYNARGQRIRIALGERRNGAFQVFTRYTYDPLTFRLQELYSWRDGLGAYPYQRLAYTYDAVGNITSIDDTSAKRTFSWKNTSNIAEGGSSYTYDALYQLIEATGRELPIEPGKQDDPLADLAPHPEDLTRLRRYTQNYEYDRNGNLTRTKHAADASGWVRTQNYDATTNRLQTVSGAGATFEHEYDTHGNIVSMPHLALMEWNADDQLIHTARNAQQHVWFSYDAAGQRVRKVFEANGTRDETLYIGGYELHVRTTGRRSRETSTLHIMDDEKRVALIESVLSDDFGELERGNGLRFLLADHLGSATVECDEAGSVISYEEFKPFGTTAFSSISTAPHAAKRRYRFTGKERDEETGLYYFGARYYAPWLSRWISGDPLVRSNEQSSLLDFRCQTYIYVNNRPTIANDPDGLALNIVVGAAVGTLVAVAIDVGIRHAIGQEITLRTVLASAAGGAVSGALAGATFGASLVAQGAAAGAVSALSGATSRAVEGAGSTEIAKGVGQDFAIGVVTFGLVKGGAKVVKSIGESSFGMKVKAEIIDAVNLVSNERGSIDPKLLGLGLFKQGSKVSADVNPTLVDPKALLGRQSPSEMVGKKVDRFAKAMKAEGYGKFPPIDILSVDGKLIIENGHHRVKAAVRAGLKEVPVNIRDAKPDQVHDLLQQVSETFRDRR